MSSFGRGRKGDGKEANVSGFRDTIFLQKKKGLISNVFSSKIEIVGYSLKHHWEKKNAIHQERKKSCTVQGVGLAGVDRKDPRSEGLPM